MKKKNLPGIFLLLTFCNRFSHWIPKAAISNYYFRSGLNLVKLPLFKQLGFLLFFINIYCPSYSQWLDKKTSITTNDLQSIYMVNSNVGYAGGIDGVFKTINGGNTWINTFPTSSSSQLSYMNDIYVHFLDENNGYAAGWNALQNNEIIVKTSDGGVSWTIQHFGPFIKDYIQSALKSLVFPLPNLGFTAGGKGRILKTTNGSTWEVLNSGVSSDLYSIFFIDPNNGFAAGDNVFLKTTNGGTTWQVNKVEYNLRDVFFTNLNIGFAITQSGKILKTTNGGTNWEKNHRECPDVLNDIFFINDSTGYIAGGSGRNGFILKTTDAGNRWEEQFYTKESGIRSIFFADTNNGISCANYGKVFNTVNGGGSITATPIVLGFSPSQGKENTTIQIKGKKVRHVYEVNFNNLKASFSIKSDSVIEARVPRHASTGNINLLYNSGIAVSANNFIVVPSIDSISPSEGFEGDTVILYGNNFTGINSVKLNDLSAGYKITSDTTLSLIVSPASITGKFKIQCGEVYDYSQQTFSVIKKAILIPSEGPSGSYVGATTDYGSPGWAYLDNQSILLSISGASLFPLRFPPPSCELFIPNKSPGTYKVILHGENGKKSVGYFKITPGAITPIITEFSPTSGHKSQTVIIKGKDFSGYQKVLFNGLEAFANIYNGTEIIALVPSGATTGPISVITSKGTAVSAGVFEVYPGYCTRELFGYDQISSRIDQVTFGSINNLSPIGCSNYNDYTSLVTEVYPGQELDLTIKTGSCKTSKYSKIRTWIDWNGNFEFEETYAVHEVVSDTYKTKVKVPANATIGLITRMRVVCSESTSGFPLDACSSGNDREDYGIKIVSALSLSAPNNLKANVAGENIVLEWKDNSSEETSFIIERSIANSDNFIALDTLAANLTTYTDSILEGDAIFYYRVKAINSSYYSNYSNIEKADIHGPVIFVNANAKGKNNGSTWNDAYIDLQKAIAVSTPDKAIWVAKGVYVPTNSLDKEISFLLNYNKAAAMFGGFAGNETNLEDRNWKENETILSGDIGVKNAEEDNTKNIILIDEGRLLNGFTIKDGNKEGYISDAGIKLQGGEVSNCIIENNNNGITIYNGKIQNCIIRNNNGIKGCGIFGEYNANSTPKVINCIIYNNDGFGVWVKDFKLHFINCNFLENKKGEVYNYRYYSDHGLSFENCIFNNHTVYNHFIIVDDYRYEDIQHQTQTKLNYCIINSRVNLNLGSGNIEADSVFANIKGNDNLLGTKDDIFYLKPSSPAIDKGDFYFSSKGYNILTDYYYDQRISGTLVDIGAVEYKFETYTPKLTFSSDYTHTLLSWSDYKDFKYEVERSLSPTNGFSLIASLDKGIIHFVDTALIPNTTYYYKVRASNNIAYSNYSNTITINTTNTPKSPENLLGEVISPSSVILRWEYAPSYKVLFKVERSVSENSNFEEIASLGSGIKTYKDSMLLPQNKYYYRIKAHTISESSNYSNELGLITFPAIPASPDNLKVINIESNEIKLEWNDNSINEDGFIIERSTLTNNSFVPIDTIIQNSIRFTNVGLSSKVKYYYRVRTFNKGGNSSYTNETFAITLANIPASPNNLIVTSVGSSSISLSWRDNSIDESGFKLERSIKSSDNFKEIARLDGGITNYTDTGLVALTKYFYRIKAFNSDKESGYSNEISAVTTDDIINGLSNEFTNNLKVSPNPFKNYFILQNIPRGQKLDVIVVNIQGIEVRDITITKENSESLLISTKSLAEGIYILKVLVDDNLFIRRIIKI